ncbi:hypothetical protein B0H15DRAFT_944031 [Mycena belliarum]|uniref:Uncharacterized protein n=1 Tax=Mycena belliarum TaxID=1033014 RepID=A0AAD6UJ03_9AGAR|nr:hypothetical protein B0H15DRAFT_944031 [Mycena belliae]
MDSENQLDRQPNVPDPPIEITESQLRGSRHLSFFISSFSASPTPPTQLQLALLWYWLHMQALAIQAENARVVDPVFTDGEGPTPADNL